jgi:Spy/CpxP family protein refolding chaperone
MQRWKKWVANSAVATLLLGSGTSAVWAANPDGAVKEDQAHQVHHGGQHDGKHGKHMPLTEQQKAALQKAGVDPQVMREGQRAIHDVLRSMKTDGHALHEIVRNSNDQNLKDQVDADLKPFRDQMGQARDLHVQNRQLHEEFISAVNASDTAKIKSLFSKMQANQMQELKHVKAAQKVIQDELAKVQKQVKK